MDKKKDQCTVFARNLPYSLTDEQLEEAFAEIGPVKSCFIVKSKGDESGSRPGQSRGIAFVTYALSDDATRATESLNDSQLHGRAIKVEFANKRAPVEARGGTGPKLLEGKRRGSADDADVKADKTKKANGKAAGADADEDKDEDKDEDEDDSSDEDGDTTEGAAPHAQEKSGPSDPATALDKSEKTCTIILGNLCKDGKAGFRTDMAVAAAKRAPGFVRCTDPANPDILLSAKAANDGCKGHAIFVAYRSVAEAIQAVKLLHGRNNTKGYKSQHAMWARQLSGEGSYVKRHRLILRNLAFMATEADIRKACRTAGFVWDVSIPRHEGGRARGFAFVSFVTRGEAEQALALLNASHICGRIVAADWALGKHDFQKAQAQGPAPAAPAPPSDDDDDDDEDSDEEDSEDDSVEDGEAADAEEGEEGEDAALHVSASERSMLSSVLSDVLGKAGGEDREENVEEDAPKPRTEAKRSAGGKGSSGASERKEQASASEGAAAEAAREEKQAITVFVRNVPPEATWQMLRAKLEPFGRVKVCRLVKDPATGRNKGTAFVEFHEQAGADAAVAGASATGGMFLAGARLALAPALSQEGARHLAASAKEGKQRDRRNLHLAREGHVARASAAAAGVSDRDLERRERLQQEKDSKLKSPNFSVSRTRLALHNLPQWMDETGLRKLTREAVLQRATQADPRILQATILKDKEKRDAKGQARSKGIAFVEFAEHEHALVALRVLNNNPEVFSADTRPIVEFAIEDAKKLRLQQQRLKMHEANLARRTEEGDSTPAHRKRGAPQDADHQARGKKPRVAAAATSQGESGGKGKRANSKGSGDGSVGTGSGGGKGGRGREGVGTDPAEVPRGQARGREEPAQGERTAKKSKILDFLSSKSREDAAVDDMAQLTDTGGARGSRRKGNKQAHDERRLDSLVEQYKSKYFGGPSKPSEGAKASKAPPSASATAKKTQKTLATRWFD